MDASRHIWSVSKGDVIQDFECDRDGFVWFDEAGLLGAVVVYETFPEAEKVVRDYAAWLEYKHDRLIDEAR